MNWKKEQLLGFSVKTIDEIERIISLGMNLVEIKIERLKEDGLGLYEYDGSRFSIREDNLTKIAQITKGVAVQFHLPVEEYISKKDEKGFNIGVLDHHDIVLERFSLLEEIFRKFALGSVLTLHPPLISAKGKILIYEREAIKNSRIFFERLDDLRLKNDHKTAIGVENVTDPKTAAGNLGNFPKHFKGMLLNTRTIGLTLDTGHRRLAEYFRVRDFLSLGFPIVNYHFHGNDGNFDPDNWDDDQHHFPNSGNIKGYDNYLRYFRRHRPPIVLEISDLKDYSDRDLLDFVNALRNELK